MARIGAECDFARVPRYLYTESAEDVDKLERELESLAFLVPGGGCHVYEGARVATVTRESPVACTSSMAPC